ncbi:sensor histidine kinase [Agrococcus jejuensis]|uniref:histidine kinase n=1 Tax=Agrococcus jejuensis TaxID=399736 RepID=A0A1G8FVC0_9MICO|nr:histidine kinase [Agrococcus jejuensis]SDH86010.1 Signal transduction histidine kinase [Agrococcus jejuensis]
MAAAPRSMRLADVALAIVVAGALALVVALAGAASPVAFALTTGLGALLLLRRRLPRTVLALSVLATCAYYTLDQPAMGVAVPVVAAVWAASRAGHVRTSVVASAALLALATFFRIRDGVEPVGVLLGYETVSNLALLAAAIALGAAMRSRAIADAQRARIDELTRAQAEREADELVRLERARISRDLHDTVGHAMAAIAMQASVGEEAVGGDDDAARAALGRIRRLASRSLRDVRQTVRAVRDDDAPARTATLAALDDVLDVVRSGSVALRAEVRGDLDALPAAVDAAAFRVLQEALTNVVRHASAHAVEVLVEVLPTSVHVRVADDGVGASGVAAGAGLAGMRERVRLLGGTLETRAADGFVVDARIPVEPTP